MARGAAALGCESRISCIGDVTIGVAYSGCRNSKCIPRPTYCSFSIDPPQVDPAIAT